MRKAWIGVAVLALALTGAACGGGGDDDAAETATTALPTTEATTAANELPRTASDFERVCTTQVGFGGATTYEKAPGTHPMVWFYETDEDSGFIHASIGDDFPAGWTVKEDNNFNDNSELKATQLVGCSDQVKQTPTGKQCEFDDDGEKVTLELVNATYEVKLYEAKTGKLVHTATIETKETECPTFVTFKKGDKKYVVTPDGDEYTNAVKPAVSP